MGVDDHGHGVSVKGMKRGGRCSDGDETVVRQMHGPFAITWRISPPLQRNVHHDSATFRADH
jgi:hypothetical protein